MCWQRRRGRCGTSRENDETLCDRQRFEQHDSPPLANILRLEPVIPQAAPRLGKRGPRRLQRILTPRSAKYLTAPGWKGIGEAAAFWFSSLKFSASLCTAIRSSRLSKMVLTML